MATSFGYCQGYVQFGSLCGTHKMRVCGGTNRLVVGEMWENKFITNLFNINDCTS